MLRFSLLLQPGWERNLLKSMNFINYFDRFISRPIKEQFNNDVAGIFV